MARIVSVLFTTGVQDAHGNMWRQDSTFVPECTSTQPPGADVTIRKEKPHCPEALCRTECHCTKVRRELREKLAVFWRLWPFDGQKWAAPEQGWGRHCCRYIASVAAVRYTPGLKHSGLSGFHDRAARGPPGKTFRTARVGAECRFRDDRWHRGAAAGTGFCHRCGGAARDWRGSFRGMGRRGCWGQCRR